MSTISQLPHLSLLSLKLTPEQLYDYKRFSSSPNFRLSPLAGITTLELEMNFQSMMISPSYADFEKSKGFPGPFFSTRKLCIAYIIACLGPLNARELFPNVKELQLEIYTYQEKQQNKVKVEVEEIFDIEEAILEDILRTSHFPDADSIKVYFL